MYYSLTFIEDKWRADGSGLFQSKNTYDDWHLVPTSRPSFSPPDFSASTIQIPGRDGLLDVSSAITKYPTYGNRTGSLEFLIYESPLPWYETYTKVANYLHGQSKKVYMEEDPAYYYEGRFSLNEFRSLEKYSTITIDYNLQPYKKARWTTTDNWEWDPFNFETGITISDLYKELEVNSTDWKQIFNSMAIEEKNRQLAIGRMTACPSITVTGTDDDGIYIWFENDELEIYGVTEFFTNETKKVPSVVFSMQHEDNGVRMAAKGNGYISIDFTIGDL